MADQNHSFIYNILPFFGPSIFLVLGWIFLIYTGNPLMSIWFLYLTILVDKSFKRIRILFGMKSPYLDGVNLPNSLEKNHINDWRYMIPVYTYLIIETCIWAWVLMLISGKYDDGKSILWKHRPKTSSQYI